MVLWRPAHWATPPYGRPYLTFYGPIKLDSVDKNTARSLGADLVQGGEILVVAPAYAAVSDVLYPLRKLGEPLTGRCSPVRVWERGTCRDSDSRMEVLIRGKVAGRIGRRRVQSSTIGQPRLKPVSLSRTLDV